MPFFLPLGRWLLPVATGPGNFFCVHKPPDKMKVAKPSFGVAETGAALPTRQIGKQFTALDLLETGIAPPSTTLVSFFWKGLSAKSLRTIQTRWEYSESRARATQRQSGREGSAESRSQVQPEPGPHNGYGTLSS